MCKRVFLFFFAVDGDANRCRYDRTAAARWRRQRSDSKGAIETGVESDRGRSRAVAFAVAIFACHAADDADR